MFYAIGLSGAVDSSREMLFLLSVGACVSQRFTRPSDENIKIINITKTILT